MLRDDREWRASLAAETRAAVERYVQDVPGGRHLAEARAWLGG
jgi:hypothetical protein